MNLNYPLTGLGFEDGLGCVSRFTSAHSGLSPRTEIGELGASRDSKVLEGASNTVLTTVLPAAILASASGNNRVVTVLPGFTRRQDDDTAGDWLQILTV